MNQYVSMISEHDKTLNFIRDELMHAVGKEKDKWQARMDQSLVERSRLMKLRDAVKDHNF